MNKNRLLLLICTSLVFLPLVPLAEAQDDTSGTIKVDVRLVEVYATIFDHKGHYVDGLRGASFQVLEDGKPQKISRFEANEQSLSCAILLDTTGSMAEALPRVKNSIVKLIDELGSQDWVAIYTFDQQLFIRQDFTRDKSAAKRAVLRTRAEGGTALFDALSETAREVSKRPGKKALIVFTDGDDNASVLNANAAITHTKKLGIPLYSVAEGEAVHSSKLKKILKDLSERTGGINYEVKKPNEIESIFQEISGDLQHLYMICYKSSSTASEDKWRKIDLEVNGLKDYRVRAKEGYFPD
jgi:Ca-activated chloride channel family protein